MALSKFVFIAVVACVPAVVCGATIGQIDTFQDGTTDGWFAGGLGLGQIPTVPPQVVSTGGPLGAGDQFLLITAVGGNGPGSRLVAMNSLQWAGNYLSPGISGIAMDLNNFSATELTIRLLFEDPILGPPVDRGVTTFGQVVPAGSGWIHAVFPISPADLTMLTGDANALLGNTTLLRIIHSPTAGDAVPVVGALGVDNITAVPEPSTFWLLLPALAAGIFKLRRG